METHKPAGRRKAKLQRACQIFLELAFIAGILVGLFFPILIVHADPGASLYDEASAQTAQVSQQHALPAAIGLPPLIFPRAGVIVGADPSPTRPLPSPSGGRSPPAS